MLVLLADDPVALTDVPALAGTHGWSVTVEHAEDHSVFHLADDSPNGSDLAR